VEVTVVIPAKNSPSLREAVHSVAVAAEHCGQVPVRVIVVDSSAHPPSLPPEGSRLAELTVLHRDCGLLAARIVGVQQARGDWILNLDSDQTLHPDLFNSILASTRAAVVIPEIPLEWNRWTSLVHRMHQTAEAEFRAHPSLSIPVIPRAYRRILLSKAADAIVRDGGRKDLGGLPTQHEDTILLSYFLRVNGLTISEAIDFTNRPIYHSVASIGDVARKYYHYGRDLGAGTRRARRGELNLDPRVWADVYRVDVERTMRYWVAGQGLNLEALVYDGFRSFTYVPGVVAGYALTRRLAPLNDKRVTGSSDPVDGGNR
jgi:glycosyltransferase involved in cell wall biosynthesis